MEMYLSKLLNHNHLLNFVNHIFLLIANDLLFSQQVSEHKKNLSSQTDTIGSWEITDKIRQTLETVFSDVLHETKCTSLLEKILLVEFFLIFEILISSRMVSFQNLEPSNGFIIHDFLIPKGMPSILSLKNKLCFFL